MNEAKRQQILNELVNVFGRREWFRDGIVYSKHETNGLPTLEIKVNYIPVFEKKDVAEFSQSKGLQYFFTVVGE